MEHITAWDMSNMLEQMLIRQVEQQGIAELGEDLQDFLEILARLSVPEHTLFSYHDYYACRA